MLLAGDVGGTKTSLGIYSPESGPRDPRQEGNFPSADYPDLESLVHEYLTKLGMSVDRAVFGVPGAVVGGRVTGTNVPWTVDETLLRKELGISSVRVLNDLEAVAYAIPVLEGEDLATLSVGQATPTGALAIVAPGTGLGEAFLTWDGTRYRPQPSEGGHTDFAPRSRLEIELLRYLQDRFEHVSYERVCSGLGLPNIYAFLKESGYADEPDWLAKRLRTAADPAPIIVDTALDAERPCDLCRATLSTFVSILAAEAGNLALKVMAVGGVYLGGGIPRRILPALEGERFMQAFRSKGRLSYLLARIPVYVILNPKAGLLGAAAFGLGE